MAKMLKIHVDKHEYFLNESSFKQFMLRFHHLSDRIVILLMYLIHFLGSFRKEWIFNYNKQYLLQLEQ